MNLTLYDLLHVLFKRKRIFGLAFLCIFVPVAVVALSRPTLYRANARLMVFQARAYPVISSKFTVGKDEVRDIPPMTDLTLIGNAVQNMQSPRFLQQAARAIAEQRAHGDHLDVETAWWQWELAKKLEVTPAANTTLFEVAFRSPKADVAANVVNTVVDKYVTYQARSMIDNSGLHKFYQSQREIVERELMDAETALEGFQRRADIYSLEDQKMQMSRAHTAILQEMDLNVGKLRHSEAEAETLKARMQEMPSQISVLTYEDPQVTALHTKIVGLELDLNGLRQLYTDEDQRVQHVVEELNLAKRALEDKVASREHGPKRVPSIERLEVNTAYQSLVETAVKDEAEAVGYHAGLDALRGVSRRSMARLRKMNSLGYQYERLKAVREAKKSSYAVFLNLEEQARASEAMDIAGLTNVQIVDHAFAPERPVRGMTILMLAVGLVASLAVGAGGALGLELLRPTVHSARDGEQRVGVPVLGAIPEGA